MRIFSRTRIGLTMVVSAALGLLPIVGLVGEADAQSSAIQTQRQSASQSDDDREFLVAVARAPMMQLKPRFNGLSLNREFGKADTDTEESRSLPAFSFVKIVETRRARDYGPLWSMVVAVQPNGTPLRTPSGKMIKGWARTDCFVPSDLSEPIVEPPPKVSVAPTSAQSVPS
jgi:hypothetical protein